MLRSTALSQCRRENSFCYARHNADGFRYHSQRTSSRDGSGFVASGPEKESCAAAWVLAVEIDKNIASGEDLRDPYGIIVAARAAGAAGEIPLTTGDVIRTFNGEPMTTLDRLRAALTALPPNAPIVLQIQREGKLQFVTFSLQ
jgi:hypothetical protein